MNKYFRSFVAVAIVLIMCPTAPVQAAPEASEMVKPRTTPKAESSQSSSDAVKQEQSTNKAPETSTNPEAVKSETLSNPIDLSNQNSPPSPRGSSSSGISANVQAASVQVDSFMGSANLGILIQVPPGRGGIQPNVALSYSSSNRGLSLAGVGWSLDLGSIQRSTKKGVPSYDDSKDIFTMGGSQDLVADPNTANRYYSEIEGSFAKIEHISNYWLVTDKKGVKYYFGNTDDSRQYDPDNASRIFRWALNRVEDLHGNYMTIVYMKEGNQLYPQTINYTGNAQQSLLPYAQVAISYGDTAKAASSYIAGFKILTSKRIERINTSVKANNQFSYRLSYAPSISTGRDLLQSVQQIGADGTTTLPPVSFSYQQGLPQFQSSGWQIPSDLTLNYSYNGQPVDAGVRISDLNADGYPDFIRSFFTAGVSSSIQAYTYLNTKNNGWSLNTTWALDPNTVPFSYIVNMGNPRAYAGALMADINGDGLTDVIGSSDVLNSNGQRLCGGWAHFRNSLNGPLTSDTSWTMPSGATFYKETANGVCIYDCPQSSNGTVLGDVNGDGFLDLVQSLGGKQGAYVNGYAKGNKTFNLNNSFSIPSNNYTDLSQGAILVDLNGDGLSDILYRKAGESHVFMNTSKGLVEDTSSGWNSNAQLGDFTDQSTQTIDINGDGLVDLIVTSKGDRANANVLMNTGSGWNLWQGNVGDVSFFTYATQFLDANADGMMDYLTYESAGSPGLYLNQAKSADLLNHIDNGIGATTDIFYDSSAHYQNTFMPMIEQVVKSTTISDGFGHSYATSYSYANGKWDAAYREFQGFGQVKVIDAEGNYTTTTFLQDHWLKGRALEQGTYDASGNLYSKSVNQWKTQDILTNLAANQISKFVYLSRTDNYLYDGMPSAKRTAQEMIYAQNPQYGDVTQLINYGEVDAATGNDIGNDKIVNITEYVHNTSSWLIGLPKFTGIFDFNNKITSQTWFSYDGSSSVNAIPSKGSLTAKYNWLGRPGTPDPTTYYTYDAYGNLLTTQDPMGNVTKIVYDADVYLFPVTVTNALNQTSKTTYYGVEGKALNDGQGLQGLWGQQRSMTDVNNKVSYSQFDPLGRPVTVISPKDNIGFPTIIKIYQIFPNYISVTTKARIEHGVLGMIDSIEYYDGLGRLLQAKSWGPKAGQYIVSGQSEYNSRGLPVKKYLPRFTSNGLNVMDPIDSTVPSSKFTYDAMGRVIKSTNPDGRFSSVTYDHEITRMVDENGHMQKSYVDAFGRLAKKEEYTGADGRAIDYPKTSYYTLYATTKYVYDALGNLTSVIDAKNNVTTISYDALGRKIGMVDPDMGTWAYQYDDNGNLVEQKDALNKQILFSYDPLNRLKVKTSVVSPTISQKVFYGYDQKNQANALGRLNSVIYDSDSAAFVYDESGREIQSTKVINNATYKVTRLYDALNRLKTLQYPDNAQVKYLYNQAGQVVSVEDVATSYQYVKSIDYNAFGQMTQIQYGNGVTTAYTYDSLNLLLTRIYSTNTSGERLQDLYYFYDAGGQIKKIADAAHTATQTFKYDDLNRLIEAVGNYGTKTYAYDQIGNITLKDGLSYQYGFNAGVHAVTSTSDGTTYKYSANGNMISKQTSKGFWSYVYDNQNRLTAVGYQPMAKTVKKIAEYFYDGDGGRTRKVVYRYLDPAYRNDETKDIFFTQMGNINFGPNDMVTSQTTYVGNLYEIEDSRKTKNIFLGSIRIAAVTGTEVDFYHMDHLGSANIITDATGALRSLTEYDPFGKISRFVRFGSKINTGWQYFNDKPFDDETGLIFYGARYYDPKLGRFITADTIVQEPGNPQTLNRYTYCNNNPVNLIDPTGHKWSWKKFWSSFVGGVVSALSAIVLGPLGPVLAGAIAGALGGITNAAMSGGNIGQGAMWGAAFGFGSAVAGFAVSQGFGKIGQQIFDSSVVIASGINGYRTGDVAGFLGGVAGSGLVTGVNSGWRYDTAPPRSEAQNPNGFWDTAWDVVSFVNSVREYNAHPGWGTGIALLADSLALAAPGVPGGAGTLMRAERLAGKEGTEVVERWMSKAELQATKDTGLIRGGRSGTHYVTNSANSNMHRAQQRLALDHTPEVRVRLEVPANIFGPATKVEPRYKMMGGGMERTATGKISAKVLGVSD